MQTDLGLDSRSVPARPELDTVHTTPLRFPAVSVVIPALNEAENLPHVLNKIPNWVQEVVLVDGRSTDGTPEVARSLLPQIRIVEQEGRGKGDALRSGFRAAQGDIIVMLDADGSTDPREIPLFVQTLLGGADFAKGSRFLHGGGTLDMPLYRKLGNLAFVLLVRVLFGARYTDLCYGYNAFWRRVLPEIEPDVDGFEVETQLNIQAARRGLYVVEVPSLEHRRIYGSGRLRTIPDGWRVIKTIFRQAQIHRAEINKVEFDEPQRSRCLSRDLHLHGEPLE